MSEIDEGWELIASQNGVNVYHLNDGVLKVYGSNTTSEKKGITGAVYYQGPSFPGERYTKFVNDFEPNQRLRPLFSRSGDHTYHHIEIVVT